MDIRRANLGDLPCLVPLRQGLWPDHSAADHRAELAGLLGDANDDTAVFAAWLSPGVAVGLAEASIRREYVNGCDTSPVAFLEGIHVDAAHRRQGVAGRLVAAVARWGADLGCVELGSDADLDNAVSHRMHEALGFEETERVVFFRKRISTERNRLGVRLDRRA